MSKTYILQKDFKAPFGCIKAGTESVFDNGYYIFPYEGLEKDDVSGWLGNGFMATEPGQWPDWFKIKEENKSNDSFQWTDFLVYEFVNAYLPQPESFKTFVDKFKQSHTPKDKIYKCEVCGVIIKDGARFCGEHWREYTPKPQGLPLPSDYIYPNKISALRSDGSIKTFPEAMAEADKLNPKPKYKIPDEIKAENKPDWEIISFWCEATKIKSVKHINGLYTSKESRGGYAQDVDTILKNPNYKIHSVKRLSDGVTFSVGDEVIHFSDYYTEKIKEFVVPEKTSWQMWFHPERNPETVKSLSNFTKSKFTPQPTKLFTTEDGVDIFNEKDEVWWLRVDDEAKDREPMFSYGKLDIEVSYKSPSSCYKWFSTKEAAEKYIADNKPKLPLPKDYVKADHIGIDRNGEDTKPKTIFQTKKIRNFWYCYATHRGYDHTFCSDNEYHAVQLAKAIMQKNGWLDECEFPNFFVSVEDNEAIKMPKSKPQEQRIEVSSLRERDLKNTWYEYTFGSKKIDVKHIPLIRQAIEQVLNDDGKAWEDFTVKYPEIKDKQIRDAIELLVNNGYVVEKTNPEEHSVHWFHPYFTQQQVDELCEKVWDAARAKSRASNGIEVYKYEDLERYKNSQNK